MVNASRARPTSPLLATLDQTRMEMGVLRRLLRDDQVR
jgi:hypothetical protein